MLILCWGMVGLFPFHHCCFDGFLDFQSVCSQMNVNVYNHGAGGGAMVIRLWLGKSSKNPKRSFRSLNKCGNSRQLHVRKTAKRSATTMQQHMRELSLNVAEQKWQRKQRNKTGRLPTDAGSGKLIQFNRPVGCLRSGQKDIRGVPAEWTWDGMQTSFNHEDSCLITRQESFFSGRRDIRRLEHCFSLSQLGLLFICRGQVIAL